MELPLGKDLVVGMEPLMELAKAKLLAFSLGLTMAMQWDVMSVQRLLM